MQATIITIGDEILIGQIVDTNSVSIAKHLNAAGIVVHEKCSIGDNAVEISHTLQRAMRSSQVIILTGGLGPTKDDITKKSLATLFHSEMRYDEGVAAHVEQMLTARGIEFNALNRSQAEVPTRCTVLHNAHGTAPGMWFEEEGCIVISLPGVPYEMEHLMQDEVMPRLKAHFSLRQIVHRTLITAGLAESILAKRIEQWEEALPSYLKLAYLPSAGIVRLRLSAYEVEGETVADEIEHRFALLQQLIPDYVVGFEQATVEEQVHHLLIERKATLALAESCTGGKLCSKFTAMAGASAYLLAGLTTYANEAKINLLGVRPETLAAHGAVSEQTAREMAEGARRITGATYAVATTGIAGPTGGSAEKPIGTVWFAVATPDNTYTAHHLCGTDRRQVIDRATAFAIRLLRDTLNGEQNHKSAGKCK